MKLYINNDPIDITLENERTVGEVIDEVKNWLQRMQLSIIGLSINGSAVQDEAWRTLELDTVEKIQVEACSQKEFKIKRIEIAENLLTKLRAMIEDSRSVEWEKQSVILRNLSPLLEGLFGNEMKNMVTQLEMLLKEETYTPDHQHTIIEWLERLGALLQNRRRELVDPDGEAHATIQVIQKMQPAITECALLLQTGRDKEAMELVVRFCELLSKLLRILPYMTYPAHKEQEDPAAAMQKNITALHTVLNELVAAFESNDTVLIGDLLEYEIVPQIDSLLEAVHPQS